MVVVVVVVMVVVVVVVVVVREKGGRAEGVAYVCLYAREMNSGRGK